MNGVAQIGRTPSSCVRGSESTLAKSGRVALGLRRTNSPSTVCCVRGLWLARQTQVRQTLVGVSDGPSPARRRRPTRRRSQPLLCAWCSGSGLWLWALHVPCPAGGRVNCQQCLTDIRRRHPSSLNCTARFAPASRPAFCSGTRCARVDGRRGARRRRAAVRVRRCLCSPRLRQASDLPGRAASQ